MRQLTMMKLLFRLIMLLALVLFLGVFYYALKTDQANVGPTKMISPFPSAKPIVDGAPASRDFLAIQNLSGRELAGRINDVVAEALSFNKNNYALNIEQNRKYFTPEGYEQYLRFINGLSLQQSLAERDLQSGVIFENAPLELTSGVFDGRYKWVFETPIVVSLIPRTSETYRNQAIQPINRRFLLRTQFSRVPDPADAEAVRIEIWDVLPPRPLPKLPSE